MTAAGPAVSRRVAVTGAQGRLGRALVDALAGQGINAVAWSRPDYDLDDPAAAARMFGRDRPGIVLHAAAWTDVDGCAAEPELAMRRNGDAVRELAAACVRWGARLLLISTNEVFSGDRTDRQGYTEADVTKPANPYGQSKLAGEVQAAEGFALAGRADDLLIARTAWLFGPPGNDFPTKILAAADRLSADEALRVVDDEFGSPTYSIDLAETLVGLLLASAPGGTYHLANEGSAARLEVATRVLGRCRPARTISPISRTEFVRRSSAPAWAVLANSRAATLGFRLRSWEEALDAYLESLCPA